MIIDLFHQMKRINGSRVLVTGGAGFIGSHLVDKLLAAGAEQITILDDLSRARSGWLKEAVKDHPNVNFVQKNLIDCPNYPELFTGVDVVYHLAAVSRVVEAARDPGYAYLINAYGTVLASSLASQFQVPKFIFCSSREVYGDPEHFPVSEDQPYHPKNAYGASKVAAEAFLNTIPNKNQFSIILRLANVFGPGDIGRVLPSFIEKAKNNDPIIIYGGEQELDLVWIGDITNILVACGFGDVTLPGPINIGSGFAIPLVALAEHIKKSLGSTSPIQCLPARPYEVIKYQSDISLARRFLGIEIDRGPLEQIDDWLDAEGLLCG